MAMLCRVLEAADMDTEIYFAIASTLFCLLLHRGRTIPGPLAWLGLLSSGGLVVQLLAQQTLGLKTDWSSPLTWAIWFPLLIFELSFAALLLSNRARPTSAPAPRST